MRVVVVALVLAIAFPAAAQQSPAMVRNQVAQPFTGGQLDTSLILDATNTLCSQTLSLAFEGDLDLGLQRAAANTLAVCASSGVNFNGPIVVTQSGDVQTYIQAHTINAGGGSAARSDLYATMLDSGNSLQGFLSVFGANFGTSFLRGKVLLGTSALVTDLVVSASDRVVISPASTGTGSSSTEFLTVDIVSGVTGDVIVGDSAHVAVDGTAPAIAGGSTCASTSITATSTDTAGSVTGTCDANETIILTLVTQYTTNAPECTISAGDADAVSNAFFVSATTSAVTFTATVTDADPAILRYHCVESR